LENVVLIFNDEDFLASRACHGWPEPTRERAPCQDEQGREARANSVDGAGCSDVWWTPVMCEDLGTDVTMS
jgi:hypothetical protein